MWKPEHRLAADRSGSRYPSDLTDAEWAMVEALILARPPQRFIAPAINPFSSTNKEMDEAEIDERLSHYKIPTDLPLVVQISRLTNGRILRCD